MRILILFGRFGRFASVRTSVVGFFGLITAFRRRSWANVFRLDADGDVVDVCVASLFSFRFVVGFLRFVPRAILPG